ncbi:MAG: U32 family peptidase [Muribaculaceae bacterium]
MKPTAPRRIELLAPARNAEIAIEAIKHGADAVYMGAQAFGARAAAGNSIDDIARVVDFAHLFGARVYITVNTIIYDRELHDVEQMIAALYRVGVDALIVQDMGILRMDIPPIELHASTQCDIRTPEKARFLEAVGFSQLVLARELCADEIKAITDAVKVPVECFVHGALCVSLSGRCQASEVLRDRSANRGECAQICRLPYDLTDARGNVLVHDKHLLSLRDFNQSDRVADMLAAGVSSLKIEGRLKDAAYVKNVVAHYRRMVDSAIAASQGAYVRASQGVSEVAFVPDVTKSFNRSFTHYFFDGRRPDAAAKMASTLTPKSLGEEFGVVDSQRGAAVIVKSGAQAANGDGFSFFGADGKYLGFRANKVEGNRIFPLGRISLPRGTKLFRTFDKTFDDALQRDSASRRIEIDITLSHRNGCLSLEVAEVDGTKTVVSCNAADVAEANTPQADRQRAVLTKLGNTIFAARHVTTPGYVFIPSSMLTQLRRDAIEALLSAKRAAYRFGYRKPEDTAAKFPATALVSSDNVANHLAESFYRAHGVTAIEPAIEVKHPAPGEECPVMHTRYCLRRQLGACLLTPAGNKLPRDLYLRSGDIELRVECTCSDCGMKLYATRKK